LENKGNLALTSLCFQYSFKDVEDAP